jgi:hypothetical protein
MDPMMTAPTNPKFTWCVEYLKFASVVGDGFGISSRRMEARISGEWRESVGVLAWGAGKRMFERD